jgi:large subunit ribosomal protein L25
MSNLQLSASKRSIVGRKVKRLRKEGILPGNIYGKGVKSQSIQVDLSKFKKLFKEAGESTLVEIDLSGKKLPVLVHNIQTDPVTDIPTHVDFLQVNLKEKVTAQVPVELVGESPAEKQGLGTAVQYVDEIEVEALPTDLPEKFEIDLTSLLNVGDAIQVKDVKVDTKKVEIQADSEGIIVKVEAQKEEAELPTASAEEVAAEGTEAITEPQVEVEEEIPQEGSK